MPYNEMQNRIRKCQASHRSRFSGGFCTSIQLVKLIYTGSKGGTAVKLENLINYYYALSALQILLKQGLLSESEYEKVCRYNAEIFRPGREYI